MESLIGQTIGRYHITEQLGEGGMATVYKAYDTRLERDVAIKAIRTDQFTPASLDRMLQRFDREAKSLARLSHPNIIKVHDYGQLKGTPIFVMEYLPGGTLKQRLGKPMPWQEAIKLLLPVAEALDYAHSLGIIHRDIKPSNILLTSRGQPMLTDFGIAKLLETDDASTLTATGAGIGTPGYMAPEQWTGGTVPQSDIYSLGVVLYELITGRKPYTADTPAAILLKQVHDPLPRPRQFVPALPEAVEKLLFKALAPKPEDRYPDMASFGKALESLIGNTQAVIPSALSGRERTGVKERDDSRATLLQEVTQDTPATGNPDNSEKKQTPIPLVLGVGGILLAVVVITLVILLGKDQPTTALPTATTTPTITTEITDAPTITIPPAITEDITTTATDEPTPPPVTYNLERIVWSSASSQSSGAVQTIHISDPTGKDLIHPLPTNIEYIYSIHKLFTETVIGFIGYNSARGYNVYLLDLNDGNTSSTSKYPLVSYWHWDENEYICWSDDGTKIAYVSKPSNLYYLNIIDLAGDYSETTILKSPSGIWYPQFSMDGESIAYLSAPEGSYNVFVANSDGTENRQITNFSEYRSLRAFTLIAWFAEDKIAFLVNKPIDTSGTERTDFYIIDPEIAQTTEIFTKRDTRCSNYYKNCVVSPDNEYFSLSTEEGQTEIYTQNGEVLFGAETRGVLYSWSSMNTEWSPDSNKLMSAIRGLPNLSVIDVKNKATIIDSLSLPGFGSLSWFPDGQSILYANDNSLQVIDLGAQVTTILNCENTCSTYYLSPDGQQIVYIDGNSLKMVNRDGSDPVALIEIYKDQFGEYRPLLYLSWTPVTP